MALLGVAPPPLAMVPCLHDKQCYVKSSKIGRIRPPSPCFHGSEPQGRAATPDVSAAAVRNLRTFFAARALSGDVARL